MRDAIKLKHKQYFEKKNPKKEAETSNKNKNKENQEEKIEEITKMLRVYQIIWPDLRLKEIIGT